MNRQKNTQTLQRLDKDTIQPSNKNNVFLHIQPDRDDDHTIVKITCKSKSIGCLRDDVIRRKRSRGVTFGLIDCYTSTLRTYLEQQNVIEPEINNQTNNANTLSTSTNVKIPQGMIRENGTQYGGELKHYLNRI